VDNFDFISVALIWYIYRLSHGSPRSVPKLKELLSHNNYTNASDKTHYRNIQTHTSQTAW